MHNSQEYQPSTCSSTTLSVEAGGLKGGLWISRLTSNKKQEILIMYMFIGRYSYATVLPFIRLLIGAFLWAPYFCT